MHSSQDLFAAGRAETRFERAAVRAGRANALNGNSTWLPSSLGDNCGFGGDGGPSKVASVTHLERSHPPARCSLTNHQSWLGKPIAFALHTLLIRGQARISSWPWRSNLARVLIVAIDAAAATAAAADDDESPNHCSLGRPAAHLSSLALGAWTSCNLSDCMITAAQEALQCD